jgi:hypothetical protein
MHSYRVVLEALRDPVAFEQILSQIEKENHIDNPVEGHDYASELVEVFEKIHTDDQTIPAEEILEIMENLEVLLDHAKRRLGDGVCGWLEASLQVSWDCWSTRFNKPRAHLFRHRLT